MDCPVGTKPVVRTGAGPVSTVGQSVQLNSSQSTGFVAGRSTELTDRRTADSSTFSNPDGTKTLRVYSGATFTRDARGAMVPININLARGGDQRYRPVAAGAVSFAPSSSDPVLADVDFGQGATAGFAVADQAGASTAVVDDTEIRYPDVRLDADVVLSAADGGFKDRIVLKSPAAPTTWRFPLRLRGLTPKVTGGGSVALTDAQGAVRGIMPPGFMEDSIPDPRTGGGTRSNGVTYALVQDGEAWILEVALDQTWLRDPARKYPVIVDPTVRDPATDDTFVSSRDYANRDNSRETFLKVGSPNGGGEVAASYLRFPAAENHLYQLVILQTTLNLYSTWSYACVPAKLDVYRVTREWHGYDTTAWPGPGYESTAVGSKTFARGGSCTGANAQGWEAINLSLAANQSWYGLTLRASSTDRNGEKFFRSYEYGAPNYGVNGPSIDFIYSDQGATLSTANHFDPPVQESAKGTLAVTAYNLGGATWTPTNGYRMGAFVTNSTGATVQTVYTNSPYTAGKYSAVTFMVGIGPLPAGNYRVWFQMVDPSNRRFDDYYGSPHYYADFSVVQETPPVITAKYPPNNATVDSLRPTLWAGYFDADRLPGEPRYWFKACGGTADAPVGCVDTGWINTAQWVMPAGMLSWGKVAHWYVAVYDGKAMTYLEGPNYVTAGIAQPEITHHLAGAEEGTEPAGLNPQVGNYGTGVVDASVSVPGPPLEIRRTYNSQDPRGNGQSGNRAGGRTATGSAACTAAEGPEKAVNGSTADKWCSAVPNSTLQVYLGSLQTIGSVVVRHAGAGGESPTLNTRNFTIDTSVDGTVWQLAANVTGNTWNVTTHRFAERPVRYIRMTITAPTQSTDTAARIYEFEAYGVATAFGAGWSTPLDQRITTDNDGSSNVVVTLATGQQVRFGKNPDGTYASPAGGSLTLVRSGTAWVLRDTSGDTRTFNDQGLLVLIRDAYGREQQYTYNGSQVSQIKDMASGRSIYLTWTAGLVTAARIDAPVAGGAQPTWTYEYTGYTLTKVCSPLSAGSCVSYQYQAGSHYRSTVIDDNPVAYWPFGETSGAVAANVVARSVGEGDATYTNTTLGAPGALQGTLDTAATFSGGSSSTVKLPDNLVVSTLGLSVELWFKAGVNANGVLFSEADRPLPAQPGAYAPALYVGTDYKLHGKFWSPTGSSDMTSRGRVDDGGWHHVVLAVNTDQQSLYLDGERVGNQSGNVISHLLMGYAAVGNGWSTNWVATPGGAFPFTGQIDDVAVYRHPLGAAQVAAHYAARQATWRLTKAVEPGPVTALQVTYDSITGRVATMQDGDGAAWNISQPTLDSGSRFVTVSSTGRDSVTYGYDSAHGDALVTRKTGVGTEKWSYDANGYVNNYKDANGRERLLYRDARGNVTADVVLRSGVWAMKTYGYYYNAADSLDPRNDRVVWNSGARNGWDLDAYNQITYQLDAAGRTTQIVNPTPAGAPAPTETIEYTTGTETAVGGGTVPAGLVKRSTNKLGGVTVNEYDSYGNQVRSTDPLGLITTYGYDLLGRNTTRTQSAVVDGQTVTYGTWTTAYNAASLVDNETAPGVANPITNVTHTRKTTYTYDAAGHVRTKVLTDTTGADPGRTWAYTYDGQGRLNTSTGPDNGTTTQDWNTAGDIAKVTAPNGLVTEYRYDDLRHLIETTAVGTGVDPADPGATRLVVESRAYDPAGQLARVVDAMGRETDYTYYSDGLPDTTSLIHRDAQGAVTATEQLAKYEYDYGGNVARFTGPGGVVHDYDYDDAGLRNRDSIDPAGVARSTIYTFNSAGQVTTQRRTNGFTFMPARSAETPYLFDAGASQVDPAGDRYADGNVTFTYRFTLPADTATATVNVEIDNQYVIMASTDNQHWREVVRETRPIQNGSNRTQWFINLATELATSKTIYLKVGDSQPADGWGGAVSRVAMEYTRTGDKPALTTTTYDVNGHRTGTTVDNTGGSPATLTDHVQYDARGLATRAVDPTGATTDRTYDASGQLLTETEPVRTVWRGGVSTAAVRPVTTYGRNTFGEPTDVRDAYGNVSNVGYDGLGRPTRVTLPPYTTPGGTTLTPTATVGYTFDGQPAQQTDALGRTTSSIYDKYGRLTLRTDPDPDGDGPLSAPQWSYSYDRAGETTLIVDPTGAQTTATYDEHGRPVTSTAADRSTGQTLYYTTTYGYDGAGNRNSVKTPLNHTTTTEYDAAGDVTRITDPVGLTQEMRYNAVGAVTTQILNGARASTVTYDAAGRAVGTADHKVTGGVLSAPLRTTQTTYDAASRPLVSITGEGRKTQYGYDGAGQIATVAQLRDPLDAASAVTTQLGYDALGRPTHLVDGNGHATDTGYNSWGLATDVTEGGNATWTTVYDAAGQAVQSTSPGGVSTTATYDALGRVLTETGTGAEQPTVGHLFAYDAAGRLTRASSPTGDTTYVWNDRGLQTGAHSAAGDTYLEYNGEGKLITRTDATGVGVFDYDAAGRLTTILDSLTSQAATMTYTPTGELGGVSYGAGRPARAMTYDDLGRLSTDTVKNSAGTTVLSTAYTYDADDLPKSRNTTGFTGGGTSAYGYDGLGRLTGWTRPDGQQISYGYDAASNLTTTTGPGGTRTNTYDARNRLLSATGAGEPSTTNVWTDRGTLASRTTGASTVQYSNDAFDKPTRVQAPGYTVQYSYDALGRLAQRNGISVLYNDLTNNAVTAATAFGDALIFRAPDGTAYSDQYGANPARLLVNDLSHGDQVGAIGNTSGNVLASRSYTPYGQTAASSGAFSAGFQGGYTDFNDDLVNASARWYDPATGGFLSRDSIDATTDLRAAANRYGYSYGSPVANSDPTGRCPVCVIPVAELALWAGVALAGYYATKTITDQWARQCSSSESGCFGNFNGGNWGTSSSPAAPNPYMSASLDKVRGLVNAIGSANLYAEVNRQLSWNATPAAILAYIEAHYSSVPAVKAFNEANNISLGSTGAAGGAATTTWQPTSVAPTVTSTPSTTVTVPIAAPAPPAVQSPALVRPTINLGGAAGGQLINSVGAGTTTAAAANVPNILAPGASADDAVNTAVAAAAAGVGAEVASDATANGKPPKCEDDDPLKLIIDNLVDTIVGYGLAGIDALLTPGQSRALEREAGDERKVKFLQDVFRGNRIHKKVFELLDRLYPGEWTYRHGGKGNAGPDFTHRSGRMVELTTKKELAAHQARGGEYDDACYSLYELPTFGEPES
ncbi:LamG-like jellyroll fold domain-containing protein [Dactylosporangium sp. CA-052675]|uniref:LamG-like jellyroll fold domain-containing protein n=1 Tax=Dactylosporangium sp. CA-052675 TaxID=3239927 RepID=UPI003D8E8FD6